MTKTAPLVKVNGRYMTVPTSDELAALIPLASMVRVIAAGEKLWLTVTAIDGETITGRIENDLCNGAIHGLSRGDVIELGRSNVCEVAKVV